MRTTKLTIAFIAICFTGCASMNKKFRTVPAGVSVMEKQLKQFAGKTPKDVAAALGEPISLGFNNKEQIGYDKYYMTYVINEGGQDEISTASFMMGGTNLTCRYFIFHKDDGYKLTGHPNNAFDLPCANLQNKGWYTYDDSKIK